MTRHGKIARLPRSVRDELNRRLQEGEVGKSLVEWLKGRPEVRAMIEAQFGGKPITEQNLSEWKQGGFVDWQRNEEMRAWVSTVAEESDCLEEAAGAQELTERLAASVLAGLARKLREMEGGDAGPEQCRALLEVTQQLCQLRRADAEAERVRLAYEQWDWKVAEEHVRKQKAADHAYEIAKDRLEQMQARIAALKEGSGMAPSEVVAPAAVPVPRPAGGAESIGEIQVNPTKSD